MKTFMMSLVLFLSASSVFALEGYDATRMTCAQVQAIVQQDGEIAILHKPFGSMTYYADRARCDEFPIRADARPGFEPTMDRHRCLVGWRCYFHGN